MTERPELIGLDLTKTSGGQPDVLGVEFTEDDCRFLGLYHCNGLVISTEVERSQQMQTEEAVHALEGIGRESILLLEEVTDPCGVTMLQTMSIWTIPHQLAVMDNT